MLPTSIRWRLPITYAMIALLATLALGVVLITTLRGYYAQREFDHLRANAQAIGNTISEMYGFKMSKGQIQSQMESLAFLAQARVRLVGETGEIIVDSGDGKEPRTIALSYSGETSSVPAPTDIIYNIEKPGLPSINGKMLPEAPDAPHEAWSSMIDIVPRFVASMSPTQDRVDVFNRRLFVAVAGTPYGFGLSDNREFAFDWRRSDQEVETPVFDNLHKLIGFVRLSDGPAYGTEIVDGVARALIGAGTIAVLLAAAAGWLISRQMSRPLLVLADVTRRMADGNLSARVAMNREDEIGLLANSFNHMASRVENTVVTLRRFVADAAHELHTPITALHANLELAATDEDFGLRQIFVQRAQEQLKRLEGMTASLLDLSRLESGTMQDDRQPVDMVALMSQMGEMYASRAEQAGLSFQFETPREPIVAHVSESQLRRVVGNLLDNAIKFTPENGVIRVGLCAENNSIQIWVQDTGIGIPAEDLPHLFSRFRRARNAAAYPGSGLGLAIIKAIVEGHGGQVLVESSAQGTRFSLDLPAVA